MNTIPPQASLYRGIITRTTIHKGTEIPFCSSYPNLSTFRSLSKTIPSNTAKLSSLLVPRTVAFTPDADSGPRQSPSHLTPDNGMSQDRVGRRRRSSSIIYQEPPESIEHTSDQAALPNLNATWVNAKGTLCHCLGLAVIFQCHKLDWGNLLNTIFFL